MKNGHWMTAKDVLRIQAFKYPDKVGAKDLYKAFTFKQWNEGPAGLRMLSPTWASRKATVLRFSPTTGVEWMDFYGAAAKGGFPACR